jgi:hypothetical protein
MDNIRGLLPLSDAEALEVRKNLVWYWNEAGQCPRLRGVLGELVRETEIKVTELLETGQTCDVQKADRLTAAFHYLRVQFS